MAWARWEKETSFRFWILITSPGPNHIGYLLGQWLFVAVDKTWRTSTLLSWSVTFILPPAVRIVPSWLEVRRTERVEATGKSPTRELIWSWAQQRTTVADLIRVLEDMGHYRALQLFLPQGEMVLYVYISYMLDDSKGVSVCLKVQAFNLGLSAPFKSTPLLLPYSLKFNKYIIYFPLLFTHHLTTS